jgi:hypothetical protein
LALAITIALALCLVPLIVLLTSRYGAVGSACAWLTLNVLYLLFGTWMTHRQLYRGEAAAWLVRDVLMPLLVSGAVVVAGWWSLSGPGHALRDSALAGTMALLAIAANLALFPNPLLRILRRNDAGNVRREEPTMKERGQ